MLNRSKPKLIICCIFIIFTIILIWGNSLLNGEASGSISGGLSAWIGKFIPFLSPESPNGHFILRKCAHFSVFFLLGLELFCFFGMLHKDKVLLPSIAIAAAVASIDECIQRFIPDRHGCISDVLLDISGAVAGMLLLYLWYTLLQRKKLKQERSI